jgi:hypothetical protein
MSSVRQVNESIYPFVMSRALPRIGLPGAVLAGVVSCLPAVSAQAPGRLAALTVPPEQLPAGCRLEPVTKNPDGTTKFVMNPGNLGTNPWIGTRIPTVGIIRGIIEGPLPGETSRSARGLERASENTVGAYAAAYLADDGVKVLVWAVQFDDPNLTYRATLKRIGGETPRIIVGPIAAHVTLSRPTTRVKGTALGERCYDVVRNYISSLK